MSKVILFGSIACMVYGTVHDVWASLPQETEATMVARLHHDKFCNDMHVRIRAVAEIQAATTGEARAVADAQARQIIALAARAGC